MSLFTKPLGLDNLPADELKLSNSQLEMLRITALIQDSNLDSDALEAFRKRAAVAMESLTAIYRTAKVIKAHKPEEIDKNTATVLKLGLSVALEDIGGTLAFANTDLFNTSRRAQGVELALERMAEQASNIWSGLAKDLTANAEWLLEKRDAYAPALAEIKKVVEKTIDKLKEVTDIVPEEGAVFECAESKSLINSKVWIGGAQSLDLAVLLEAMQDVVRAVCAFQEKEGIPALTRVLDVLQKLNTQQGSINAVDFRVPDIRDLCPRRLDYSDIRLTSLKPAVKELTTDSFRYGVNEDSTPPNMTYVGRVISVEGSPNEEQIVARVQSFALTLSPPLVGDKISLKIATPSLNRVVDMLGTIVGIYSELNALLATFDDIADALKGLAEKCNTASATAAVNSSDDSGFSLANPKSVEFTTVLAGAINNAITTSVLLPGEFVGNTCVSTTAVLKCINRSLVELGANGKD